MTALRVQKLELHLTDRDVRILEDLEEFRLLTTRQIQRLHLPAKPFGSHATVSAATRGTTRILNRLEGLGAIERLERRIGGQKHGSAPTIWHIGGAGERYLRARRGETGRRRYHQPNAPFIAHTLAIAEVATALREQVSVGRFEVLELASEPTCWRDFTGPGGQVLTFRGTFSRFDWGWETVAVFTSICRQLGAERLNDWTSRRRRALIRRT